MPLEKINIALNRMRFHGDIDSGFDVMSCIYYFISLNDSNKFNGGEMYSTE